MGIGDDGNDDGDDDELTGLCGAQSGPGEKKISDVTLSKAGSKSDVTLTKTSNGSKVDIFCKTLHTAYVQVLSLKVIAFSPFFLPEISPRSLR